MIRHLVGGGPGRRDVLTECCLSAALPGSLVTELEDVNCRDCRWSLIGRGICPVCGEKRLSWSPHPKKLTSVVDGRLTMNDVTAVFYLACDYCSETLVPGVDLDTVAAFLTSQGWTPARNRGQGGSSAIREERS